MAVERGVTQQTGQIVRVLEITAMQGDGSVGTVEMQVVSIADRNGRVLSLDGSDVLNRILDKLEEIRFEAQLRGD